MNAASDEKVHVFSLNLAGDFSMNQYRESIITNENILSSSASFNPLSDCLSYYYH